MLKCTSDGEVVGVVQGVDDEMVLFGCSSCDGDVIDLAEDDRFDSVEGTSIDAWFMCSSCETHVF